MEDDIALMRDDIEEEIADLLEGVMGIEPQIAGQAAKRAAQAAMETLVEDGVVSRDE